MRSRRSSLTAAGLGLLLLSGCAAATGDMSSGGVEADAGYATEDQAAADEPAAARDGAESAEQGRQLFVTTGRAEVSVTDPRVAAVQVATYTEHLGGHVQERMERGSVEDEDATAFLVLRVPADRVTDMLRELGELGDVTSSSSDSVEVTGQAQDLTARIRALEVSVKRLEGLLADADTTADLVAAEQALTDRQEQLESLQAQSARLADRVALATLEVQLWMPDQAPEEPPTGFWGGLVTGWESLVGAVSGLLLALGVLLPWLVALGLVGLVVLAVVRTRRRRRPATPAPAAAPSSAAPAAAPASAPVAAERPVAATDGPAPSAGTPTQTSSQDEV